MSAIWLVVRAGLRSRWRPWLTLAVMVGLVGGLVMAVAAGARRTDAAYPALVAWSTPPDDLLTLTPAPTFARVSAAEVRSLPQVAAAGEFDGFGVLFPATVDLVAPVDGTLPGALWHRKLLAGALPDPGRADEADISFTVAQAEHLAVGGMLRVTLLGAGDKPVPFAFRVAGTVRLPGRRDRRRAGGVPAAVRHRLRLRVGDARLRPGVRSPAADGSRARGPAARRGGGRAVPGARSQPPGRRQAGQ